MNSLFSVSKKLCNGETVQLVRYASTTRPLLAGYWNYEWKPAPYPKTPEERTRAAKKYNLLPEEYEPYPTDDGCTGFGDYPKLPFISDENKDNYYPYDLIAERRNYGEPLHIEAIYMTRDRWDTHAKDKFKYSPFQMFCASFGSVGILFLLAYFTYDFKCFPPVAAKPLPKPGVVHYTYELKNKH